MGNEVKCLARIDGKREEGKALLETTELIFLGAACRVRIAFGEIESVAALGGELRIVTKGREFAFAVGPAAEKWREKILHPKTRMEKLGVKAATRVETMGDRERSFLKELEERGADLADGKADRKAELIFWFVNEKSALRTAPAVARKIRGAAGLWIVYPKGRKEITESDVLGAGRKAGLKDVKVVGFSPTHTALKFVIPAEKR